MATARDIIKSSLRLIGAIAPGEAPTAAEISEGMDTLNDLLDSWSNENLLIPFKTTETFDLIAGQQSYTMGLGGDFDTTWPIEVIDTFYKNSSSGLELPIKELTLAEWSNVALKNTRSNVPRYMYVETEFPLKVLKFYPTPNEAKQVVVYSNKSLVKFANASDSLTLPSGYARALKYNLAVEIAPEYGTEATMSVQNTAVTSKALIESKNIRVDKLRTDPFLSGRSTYNWRIGE